MSQKNVETIRGLFRGVEERDLEAYLAVGHPEVVIREPDSLPYGGEFRGLDGLRRHAAGWMRTWAPLQPGDERKHGCDLHRRGRPGDRMLEAESEDALWG
jgi:uncharacterized protein